MGVSTEQSKRFLFNQSNSVHFSHSVVSDSLRPHGCTTPGLPVHHQLPGVYSNSFPLSRWCHPTISSSVVPFSSHLQSFPASGSFQMSQLFASGGQSTGVSASTSVLPVSIQDWFPLEWTGCVSLQSKAISLYYLQTSRDFSLFLLLIFLITVCPLNCIMLWFKEWFYFEGI